MDRAANTSWTISPVVLGTRSGLRFSGDGRFLAYAASPNYSPNYTNQVYLYDFQTATNLLVSRSYSSGGAAYGASDSTYPDIASFYLGISIVS